MSKLLTDQVALVTGASSGIGAGVAKAMAADGATVVLNYPDNKSKDDAQKILGEIISSGGKAILQMADVSRESQVQEMFTAVVKELGTIDILVNNAGIQKDSPFEQMTLEDWNEVIGVNLTGQFLCAREAIREFLRRGVKTERSIAAGKIICMSSVHQVIPWAGHANYATSKGGIKMLMESLAQEFAPKRIRINSIAPGAIKTHINEKAWDTPAAEKSLITLIPYGRVGVPEDIGRAAVWLASDQSDYVTGATLFVDGGMTLFPGFSTNG